MEDQNGDHGSLWGVNLAAPRKGGGSYPPTSSSSSSSLPNDGVDSVDIAEVLVSSLPFFLSSILPPLPVGLVRHSVRLKLRINSQVNT